MSKPKLGSGKRFENLTAEIKKGGYSEESAKAMKHGAKKMAKLAAKGKK